jgi:hypothetical protein
MRDEMLKRLDAFLEDWGDFKWSDEGAAAWLALRAELVAERCENCKHWDSVWPGPHRTGACDELPARPITNPDFCCNHFEAQKR